MADDKPTRARRSAAWFAGTSKDNFIHRSWLRSEGPAIRAHPLDGVVLLAGCDKTTPATLTGAASVDLPAIVPSDRGVDFDFLLGCRGDAVPRQSH